jgi:hypothetical protein
MIPAAFCELPGLSEKTAKRLQQNTKGVPPSVTRMRDPVKEYGRGCDTAGYGSCRTMGTLEQSKLAHDLLERHRSPFGCR